MQISEVMSRELVTTAPATTVAEAATIMDLQRVGSLLVVGDGELIGIFTERDVVRAVSHSAEGPNDMVGDWMTGSPVTTTPDTSVGQALDTMLERGFRHLPVVDAGGGPPLGMVSMRDLSRIGGTKPART